MPCTTIRGVLLACGLSLWLVAGPSAFAGATRRDEPPRKATHKVGKDKKSKDEKAGPATGVGLIEIHGELSEQPQELAWLLGSGEHMTLREAVESIRDAAEDDQIQSLVIRLRDAELHLTQVEELGSAIEHARKAGKKVQLFCDNYETPEAVLGSYCDEAIMQAGGGVSVPGMYMEEMYLADTLHWVGLTPQLVQIGAYKGADEEYMHSQPSPQWEQNISGLLDGLYGNVRSHLKSGRHMDDAKLDDALRQAWMATGETAARVGLIDASVDLPDLTPHLEQKLNASKLDWVDYSPDDTSFSLDTSNPFELVRKLMKQPSNAPTRDSIAIVHIDGPIVDGESKGAGMFGEASVGSDTIRHALSEIEDEPLIKGVVVRIDSPGGSAIASEVIWQGLSRLQAKKPVWVSVGSMAASGGYYCLCGGQKVYVNPSSIVGSIGVVGGKVAMSGLYDKLKIHTHGRARGPMAGMLASSAPWTEHEQELVRSKMQETYDLFTKRVSDARKGIELSKTAEGRLFTGNEAINNHMADKVGGLDDCIDDLAAELKLTSGEYEILDYPGPKSLGEVIGDALGGMASGPNIGTKIAEQAGPPLLFGAVKELVGPRQWPQIRDHLAAFMQLRKEPVVLTAPRAVLVK